MPHRSRRAQRSYDWTRPWRWDQTNQDPLLHDRGYSLYHFWQCFCPRGPSTWKREWRSASHFEQLQSWAVCSPALHHSLNKLILLFRWGMTTASIGAQRLIVEECLKYVESVSSCGNLLTFSWRWVSQRKVFGKPLHSQAVIRAKIAAMISRVEAAQNWLESVTYQMNHMKYKDQANYLAGYVWISSFFWKWRAYQACTTHHSALSHCSRSLQLRPPRKLPGMLSK